MKQPYRVRDYPLFYWPHHLDRWLGGFERYRAWRRRTAILSPDFAPSEVIPNFPRWISRYHTQGYGSMQTRYGGEYYSLSLNYREHVRPSFSVELSKWMVSQQPNPHFKTQTPVYDQNWSEIEEHVFYTLEEAEAYRNHIVATFEDRMMEAAL